MADAERKFLIQFLAETGDAVTAMNWLGRAMNQFPSQSVNAAAETEMAMAEMETAIAGAGVSVSALGDTFTSMGRDSTAMIRAAGDAAKIGITGDANLVKFAETARQFGFVTKMSTEEAGKALSDLGVAMGYKTPVQIERLASGMTALTRSTNVTTEGLLGLLKQTAPTAKAVGVTEAAIMGLGASLSQQGLSAQKAAGPIGNILKQMQYDPMQFGIAVKMSAEELKKFGEASPDKQLELFMRGLSKMQKNEAESLLEGMNLASGQTATKMWLAAQQTQNLTKNLNLATQAMKKNVALSKEAGKVEKTLTQQFKELGNHLKAIFQATGKMLLPVVKLFVMALQGLLDVVGLLPKPVLALAAAFSALTGAILMGAWASSTKMAAGIASLIIWIGKEMVKVGGLTGLYHGLTSARLAEMAVARAKVSGASLSLRHLAPATPKAQAVITGLAATSTKAAAPATAFSALTAAAAALGVSIATLLGIVLAIVAAFLIMGVMIYKGVRMMQSADAQTRALGATLIFLTGPIGLIVLGLMALAKPLKEAGQQIYAAIQPLGPLFQQLAPLLYALGAIVALVFMPVIAPIVAFFAVLYALIPLVVGLVEGFVAELAWGLEPLVPVANALGEAVSWVAAQLGIASGEGGGFYEIMRWIGRFIGAAIGGLIAGPIRLLVWMIGGLVSIFTEFGTILWAIGAAFEWMGGVAWAIGAWISATWSKLWKGFFFALEWLKNLWTTTWTPMKKGLDMILAPINAVVSAFWSVVDAVKAVGKALTGSSPWHIVENMMGGVIPALALTRRAFDEVAASAARVSMGPVTAGGVVSTTARVATMAAARMPGVAPAPTTPAKGAGGEGGTREIKVTIPVTLTLDGSVIGRAVAEQIIEINERFMNPPGYPLRGVEPAY